MKKVALFFAILFNVIIIVYAQNQCLTTAPAPPQWIFNKSAKSLQISPSYTMNIFVHIVRSSSGQGLGTGIIPTIVNSLNSSFLSADIQFSLLGSDFIDNDYYYIDVRGKENQLFSVNARCNAIDIYVLGQSTLWGAAGLAENIPSTALIVHGSYYNTSSLQHEMGHCLGLYHTHHGTVAEGGSDINQCAELVNGSNSTICGDYISDTPADPNSWSSSSCTYTGTGVDANGDQYSPDVTNLMSYAYKPCRNMFSDLQISRIKDFINNTAILQNVFHSTISGPSLVCYSGAEFTVNNPQGATITWTPSANLIRVSTQGSNPCVFRAINTTTSGTGTIQATLNTGCGDIALPVKTVWVGNPATPDFEIVGPIECNFLYEVVNFNYEPVTWSVTPPLRIVGPNTGYRFTFEATSSGYGWVRATASNACSTVYSEQEIYAECLDLLLAPNPATDEVEVSIMSESSDQLQSTGNPDQEFMIRIYNSMGNMVYNGKKSGDKTKVSTSSFKEGNYIVEVEFDKKVLKKQLIVKH